MLSNPQTIRLVADRLARPFPQDLRQFVVAGFATEEHRQAAEQRKAGHDRRGRVDKTSMSATISPRSAAEAGDDLAGAVAERHRGRPHMGREQLGQINRVPRKTPNTKKPKTAAR